MARKKKEDAVEEAACPTLTLRADNDADFATLVELMHRRHVDRGVVRDWELWREENL